MSSSSNVSYAGLVVAVMHELRDVRDLVAKLEPDFAVGDSRRLPVVLGELEAAGATLKGAWDLLRKIEADRAQVQRPELE